MGAMRLYRMNAVGDPGRRRVMTPGTAVVLRRAARGDPGLFDFLKSAAGVIGSGLTGGVSGLLMGAAGAAAKGITSLISAKASPPAPPPGVALTVPNPQLPVTRGTIAGAAGGPGIGGAIQIGGPSGFRLAGGATASGGAGVVQLDDTGSDTGEQAAVPVCTIKGHHFNKRGYWTKAGYVPAHTRCVKNRRRNPLNPRALHRAASRMVGFQSAAAKVERSLSKLVRRAPAARRAAAASGRRGHKAGCGCVVCRR